MKLINNLYWRCKKNQLDSNIEIVEVNNGNIEHHNMLPSNLNVDKCTTTKIEELQNISEPIPMENHLIHSNSYVEKNVNFINEKNQINESNTSSKNILHDIENDIPIKDDVTMHPQNENISDNKYLCRFFIFIYYF